MDLNFSPARYAYVPILWWPWVWWQLFQLRRWTRETGREVVFEVDARGQLYIVAISDDHRDARAWMARQSRTISDYQLALHDASGERHLCAVHYWMGRFMERGERLIYRCRPVTETPPPPALDSS